MVDFPDLLPFLFALNNNTPFASAQHTELSQGKWRRVPLSSSGKEGISHVGRKQATWETFSYREAVLAAGFISAAHEWVLPNSHSRESPCFKDLRPLGSLIRPTACLPMQFFLRAKMQQMSWCGLEG